MKSFCLSMVVVMFFLVGCAPKVVKQSQAPLAPVNTQDLSTTASDEEGRNKRAAITEEELARAERERLMREKGLASQEAGLFSDIIFEFDSYLVNPSELPKIEAVGNWMKENKAAKITAEGHCDERGTVEYNLALGQKRAESVKDRLVRMGIETPRIKSISFGKEAPLDPAHSEDAWTRNRRVHFKIDQKG